jgi:signal transduction histidine kinase
MHYGPEMHNEFAAKLVQATEDERRKLAREMHDDLNQELVVIAMEIASLQREVGSAQNERIRALRERVNRLIQTVRSLARRLHPSIVEDLGLQAALRSQFEALAPAVKVAFTAENLPQEIPAEISLCVYRIAQEAVRNAAKHSGTDEVRVRLSTSREHLVLIVQDLGRGFVLSTRKTGLGMTIMSERVRLVGGDLNIRSEPGGGTRVVVRIPLPQNRTAD